MTSTRANGPDGGTGMGDGFAGLPDDLQERFLEACLWDSTLDRRWQGEESPQGDDTSRSAWDLSLARLLHRNGFSFGDFVLLADVWEHGTGSDGDARQRKTGVGQSERGRGRA